MTENHNSNQVPAVLDRIDDVPQQVTVLTRMFDAHMGWSEEWVRKVEDDVAAVKAGDRSATPECPHQT